MYLDFDFLNLCSASLHSCFCGKILHGAFCLLCPDITFTGANALITCRKLMINCSRRPSTESAEKHKPGQTLLNP